jgi:hypothetical protein
MLYGCSSKSDLKFNHKIDIDDIRQFASEKKFGFVEFSNETSQQDVNGIVQSICDQYIDQ